MIKRGSALACFPADFCSNPLAKTVNWVTKRCGQHSQPKFSKLVVYAKQINTSASKDKDFHHIDDDISNRRFTGICSTFSKSGFL